MPTDRAPWRRFLAPGPLLWLAAALLAARFGHPARWRDAVRTTENGLDGASAAAAMLIAADMAAALIAGVLTQPIRRLWLGYYVPWPASALLRNLRGKRWDSADKRAAKAQKAGKKADQLRHERTRTRIALARPQSPTWIGDRAAALESRVRNQYGIDLPSAWPRLWLTLPEMHRADLRRANQAFHDAGHWGAWSVVYAATASAWWPVAGLAAVCLLSAVQSGRAAIAALTDLAEATVDLHAVDLAHSLGVKVDGFVLEPDQGRKINLVSRKAS